METLLAIRDFIAHAIQVIVILVMIVGLLAANVQAMKEWLNGN
jgi:hypothetical protein